MRNAATPAWTTLLSCSSYPSFSPLPCSPLVLRAGALRTCLSLPPLPRRSHQRVGDGSPERAIGASRCSPHCPPAWATRRPRSRREHFQTQEPPPRFAALLENDTPERGFGDKKKSPIKLTWSDDQNRLGNPPFWASSKSSSAGTLYRAVAVICWLKKM